MTSSLFTDRQSYRTLSLHQPYASLVAWGLKGWETRGDVTARLLRSCVGTEIAIASTKNSPPELAIPEDLFTRACRVLRVWSGQGVIFPEGFVLCVARVEEVRRSEDVREHLPPPSEASDDLLFGNWADGRFGIRLTITEVFEKPVPCSGNRGLWKWERPNEAVGCDPFALKMARIADALAKGNGEVSV